MKTITYHKIKETMFAVDSINCIDEQHLNIKYYDSEGNLDYSFYQRRLKFSVKIISGDFEIEFLVGAYARSKFHENSYYYTVERVLGECDNKENYMLNFTIDFDNVGYCYNSSNGHYYDNDGVLYYDFDEMIELKICETEKYEYEDDYGWLYRIMKYLDSTLNNTNDVERIVYV